LLEVKRAETPARRPKSRYQVFGDDKGMVDKHELAGD
jgi:hypothetical protein